MMDSSSQIVADSSSSQIVADSSSSQAQAWTSVSVDAHLSQMGYQTELGVCILFVLAAILGAIVMKGVLP